jgi:hypothetical protein
MLFENNGTNLTRETAENLHKQYRPPLFFCYKLSFGDKFSRIFSLHLDPVINWDLGLS